MDDPRFLTIKRYNHREGQILDVLLSRCSGLANLMCITDLSPLSYSSSSSTSWKQIYVLGPGNLSPGKGFPVKLLGLETLVFTFFATFTLLILLSDKDFLCPLNGVAINITMPHLS